MNTNIPGLFVAGKARSLDPGIYFGGWSLCQSAATGTWAGDSAARFAMTNKRKPIDPQEVKMFKRDLYAPLQNGGGNPNEVLLEVQKALFPYEVIILKNETRLKEALDRIEMIENELIPRMSAKEPRQLMRLREVSSITKLVELFLRSSILRTETRASHYREDHPKRDDDNWLKWVFISQRDGKMNIRLEPLPLHRYKFQIDRFYMDNFRLENT